jgi:hypothetical protein
MLYISPHLLRLRPISSQTLREPPISLRALTVPNLYSILGNSRDLILFQPMSPSPFPASLTITAINVPY